MKIFTLFVIAMLGVALLVGCTTITSDSGGQDLTQQEQENVVNNIDNSFVDDSAEISIGEMI